MKDNNEFENHPFDFDDDMYDISDSLKQQVIEELNRDVQESGNNKMNNENARRTSKKKRRRKKKRILRVIGVTLLSLMLITVFLVGTKTGRNVLYKIASHYVVNSVNKGNNDNNNTELDNEEEVVIDMATWERDYPYREEEYVTNFLIFGIEEIGGGKNTDAMIIASVNTKDKTIKLTSLLRDTYINIDGYNPTKLNSLYAKGGIELLISTIEEKYMIKIDGYANVNFESFEDIIDILGGIDIELGEAEANYLNKTNYISKKEYRNVVPGWNHLNGNQVVGYVRVRKVSTLGGANNDYGRTVRQRRVLNAIFEQYKSKNIFSLVPIMNSCLGHVNTNLSAKQIQYMLSSVIENKITTIEDLRLPVDGLFDSPLNYGGVSYPIVVDWDANIIELYKFLFNDTQEEAEAHLQDLKGSSSVNQ